MASGCCVIASRIGGIPELARDGEEALFVSSGDVVELDEALGRVAGDDALRARLGSRARARVLAEFALAGSVEGDLDWCERAVAVRRHRFP